MGDVAALTWPPCRPGAPIRLPGRVLGTRRCLFGPVDHGSTEKWLKDQFSEIYEENRKRYNFDFEKGTPLPAGTFDWDACGGDEEVKKDEEKEAKDLVQTKVTDFMRKRKSSSDRKQSHAPAQKVCRRSST